MIWFAPVAQLDRASASYFEGRRFESYRARQFFKEFRGLSSAGRASDLQSEYVGSTPTVSTTFFGEVCEGRRGETVA